MPNPPVAPAIIHFSFKQVVEALIKQQGLTEGIWGLFVEFGIGAVNIAGPDGAIKPTALIPIMKLGLQPVPTVTDIAVDAASIAITPIAKAKTSRKKKTS